MIDQDKFSRKVITTDLDVKLAKVNKKIINAGYADYDALCSAIAELEGEIATAKAEGKDVENKQERLDTCIKLKNKYDEAKRNYDGKSAVQKKVIWAIVGVVAVIVVVAVIAIVC